METLTQLDAREAAERDRAWRYEQLLDHQVRLQKDIAKLEAAEIEAAKKDAALPTLQQISALVAQLPSGLTTEGNLFNSGGADVRATLSMIAEGAMAEVRAFAAKRSGKLAVLRAKLVTIDAAITALEQEAPVVKPTGRRR
jgi:hypothetical protein